MKPQFIFSVDVEEPIEQEKAFELLDLCNEYEIPTTFAIVGKLFDDYSDLVATLNSPKNKLHEIASHSFNHKSYHNLNMKEAEEDCKDAYEKAKENNIKMKSFVFPRNEVYHKIFLKKYKFTHMAYDSKPGRIPIGKVKYDKKTHLVEIPRTLYFDRISPKDEIKLKLALLRAKIGNAHTLHLWTHLWNLKNSNYFKQLENLFILVNEDSIKKKTMGQVRHK